tara:strand:- start:74 stop:733 length:660 start_codon:yes stop_codon:yes gene_type:complete
MEQSRKEVLNVPKEFGKHGEEGVVPSDKYATRTYSARAFILDDPKDGIKDANDLKPIDFEFDGASIFEALGQLQNYLGQMFAQNMAVNMQHKLVKFYKDSMPTDLTEAEDFMRKTVPPSYMEEIERNGTFAEFHQQFMENWDKVEIPVAHVLHLVNDIVQQIMHDDNLLFWQEPELIIIGNPSVIESIQMQGATIEDEVENGVDDVVNYLKQAMKKEEE